MSIELFSKKVLRFKGANQELRITGEGFIIWVVEMDGWLRTMLDIQEDATYENLREAIPLVLQWRDRLMEWQGPWLQGGDNFLLFTLHQRHKHGESYTSLAEMINQKTTEYLIEYVQFLKELKAALPKIKTEGDLFWFSKDNNFTNNSLFKARNLLTGVKLKEDYVDRVLDDEVNNLIEGNPSSFMKDFPVTGVKIGRILRTWREGKKFQSINKENYGL